MKYIRDEDKERYDGIQAQIAQNSADWEAHPDRREGLHNANEYLYAAADKIDGGKSTYNSDTGVWSTSHGDNKPSVPNVNKSGAESTVPIGSKYNSPYIKKMKGLMRDIENSKFSYNAESDPLYQTYKNMYNREGDRALKSTLASVSAAQGGVSSYASQAAQQASNYYAQQLTDKIPELYNLAYNKSLGDLQNVKDLYGMYRTADQDEHYRFIDQRNHDWDVSKSNRDFMYQMYYDDMNRGYNYDALNSDNYFRGRNADNADLSTAYQGAQLNQNIKSDEWNVLKEKISMGYTPSSAEMAQWGLSTKDVAAMKTQRLWEMSGGDMQVFNQLMNGGMYTPTDPFGVSSGPGHGTSGYNGGSSGKGNAFTDYVNYEKEPTDGNTEGQASGQAASGGNFVPVNYPQSGANGGVPYFQSYLTAYPGSGNFQMNGNFPMNVTNPIAGNTYFPSFYQYLANNGQFRTAADNSGQTIQQQQQAATPQAAQTSTPQTDTASTADTAQDTANAADVLTTADLKPQRTRSENEEKGALKTKTADKARSETVDSERREALTDKGKEFYDQMIKNSGRLVNEKIDKSNYRDYLTAYDAYARDSQEKENTDVYSYPYGSPEIRMGSPSTLDEWYKVSGYDPKNEGRTPILTSKAEYEASKSSKRKTSGKKSSKKKTSGSSGAVSKSGTAKITPYTAKDYVSSKTYIDELMQENTELYKKGTKNGQWIDSKAKEQYEDNSIDIRKLINSMKK